MPNEEVCSLVATPHSVQMAHSKAPARTRVLQTSGQHGCDTARREVPDGLLRLVHTDWPPKMNVRKLHEDVSIWRPQNSVNERVVARQSSLSLHINM